MAHNNVCQRIYKRAMEDLDEIKYLYLDILRGCMAHVFRQARVPVINPIPEEYIETFIDALHDSFYGGCEPEFETEEAYLKYEETLKSLREDLVWSTPKFSKQLNKFLFPNGCQEFPSLCFASNVAKQIQRLTERREETYKWNSDDKSMKELYNEFYGYI